MAILNNFTALAAKTRQTICLGLGSSILLFIGCHSQPAPKKEPGYKDSFRPIRKVEAPPPKTAEIVKKTWVAGRSVQGRPIEVQSYGESKDCVLILATIHGNEFAGTPLMKRFAKELSAKPELSKDWTIVIVPVVNPDGFAKKKRRNARNVDLNRNFPAGNYKSKGSKDKGPLSEPESQIIESLLRKYQPQFILSFHQAANLLDYDGPGKDLAERLATACPLKVSRMGARPGSLGSYAGIELKIPIITVELPGKASRMDEETLWNSYGGLLIEALKKQG